MITGIKYNRVWPSQEDVCAKAQALTTAFVLGNTDGGYGAGFLLAGGDGAKVCMLPNSLDLEHQAVGTITFADNPTPADTITINGVVFTFVASGATGNEINIGATLPDTLDNIIAALNGSVDPLVSVATYTENGVDILTITYDIPGAIGETFTLAASADTVSGPTLDGAITTLSLKLEVYSGTNASGEFLPSTTLLETITIDMPRDLAYNDSEIPLIEWRPEENTQVFVKCYVKTDILANSGSIDVRMANAK